jgi:hypothetical protein
MVELLLAIHPMETIARRHFTDTTATDIFPKGAREQAYGRTAG